MSAVKGHIGLHDKYRSDRHRAMLHVRALWSDAAERKLEAKVIDNLDQQDRSYGAALNELDAELDEALKLLGE